MKNLTIGITGSGGKDYKDIRIMPGTTAGKILDDLNLMGYQLGKPGGNFFARTDVIYDFVEDGQKVFASPDNVTAG